VTSVTYAIYGRVLTYSCLLTKEATITDTRKFEDQTPENKSKATGELTDSELGRVSGGGKAVENQEQNKTLNDFNAVLQKAGAV
jgi:hypothetical protein